MMVMEECVNRTGYNYFMRPYFMKSINSNIYPIKNKDYDEFSELANRFLVNDIKNLNNITRIHCDTNHEKFQSLPQKSLFEYTINLIKQYELSKKDLDDKVKFLEGIPKEELNEFLKDNKESAEYVNVIKDYSINGIENGIYTMLEMLLKKKVLLIGNQIAILDNGVVTGFINESNFDEFREIVMKNNLLYKPLIGFNKVSNDAIQKVVTSRSEKSKPHSIESILATISVNKNISDEELQEYTRYRTMADFTTITRQHFNQFYFIMKSVGCEGIEINDLSEEMKLYNNPYDGILQKHNGYNSLDAKLKKG
jgi:hypothetical protein